MVSKGSKKNESALVIANKALKAVKKIEQSAEKKFFDVSAVFQFADWVGVVHPLAQIAQGTGVSERIGQKIKSKYMTVRGSIQMNNSAVDPDQVVRISLLEDTESDGLTPGYSDIYSTTGTALTPYAPQSFTNHGRFKILRTKTLTVQRNGESVKAFKMYVPLNKVLYYDGTGAATNTKKNLLLAFSSDIATASNPPYYTFYNRLIFEDN